ncbi:NAD(P)-dependent oxidoreductase [Micromonospora sp. C95]|uniref:NAD-dependent epimerase/dehydratase family protein n=1 Tax=Micromonospora sp. C95 TaxID=2824882 RepID=UPI001B390F77|nr:NAD-dependent epimerase/dehydratase family protein [Micromonospora sp. C95]MBQ1027539.1 NAD-dependent epimerase/dehydratase family protein [Micromonospora sp. C95]
MSRQARVTRVLVTGATGFLGRNILAALAARPDVTLIAACRTPERLPADFSGETRVGDLRDPEYRKTVVDAVDVVCHAGTWGAFWGHGDLERRQFFEPNRDLVDHAIDRGVRRFIQTSTIAIAARPANGGPIGDFSPTRHTRFWPHLDRLIDIDDHMRRRSDGRTQMVTMRLGHFVGAGNTLGMVPALVPRLRTRLVPWLAGGRARLPLVGGSDLGEAFALAATAHGLDDYESFNICGPSSPTAREVIEFIADQTGSPRPWFSVPYTAGYAFAWLMEKLHPVLPGSEPFLTRSLVHVSEDWDCRTDHAARKLGYAPREDWRDAVRESLAEAGAAGYPWPRLAQPV